MRMRMTKQIIGSVVEKFMADVPKIDYPLLADTFFREQAIKAMPPEIKKLANDPKLNVYINSGRPKIYSFHCFLSGEVVGYVSEANKALDELIGQEWRRLHDLHEKQKAKRYEAERTLATELSRYTTVESAKKNLPELAKYFPVEEAKNYPVAVVGLMDELRKLGWAPPEPKVEAKVAVKAKGKRAVK